MSTTTGGRALLYRMFDDASMFPPGNASAESAIRRHLLHRSGWYRDLVGPLLVSAGKWQEFASASRAAGSPVLEVVVLDPPRPGPADVPGVRVVGYEQAATDPLGLPLDAPTAVELVSRERYPADITGVAAARLSGADVIAKYRTGGEVAKAFPAEPEVARVIGCAARLGVPLKFTAGLHHAVRCTEDATGLERHGFLNLMLAVSSSQRGADEDELAGLIALRDAGEVVSRVRAWSGEEVASLRRSFRSFGCCGVEEPVAEAVSLGLVEAERP